jgi:hypothetical protein
MVDVDDNYVSIYPNGKRDFFYKSEVSTCYRVIDLSIEDVNSGNTCAIIKIVYGMGESYIKGKKRWLSNDGVFKYKNANICLHPHGMGHYEIKIYKNNPLFAY